MVARLGVCYSSSSQQNYDETIHTCHLLLQIIMLLCFMSHGTGASVAHHEFGQHAMHLVWINILFPLRR